MFSSPTGSAPLRQNKPVHIHQLKTAPNALTRHTQPHSKPPQPAVTPQPTPFSTTAAAATATASTSGSYASHKQSTGIGYIRCDEINRLILLSTSSTQPLQQLIQTVQQYNGLLNRVNVATAIHTTAKIVCVNSPRSSTSQSFNHHAADPAANGTGAATVSRKEAGARLESAKELLDVYLLPLFHRKLLAMQLRDVASCIWALARLGHYPGDTFMQDILRHVLQWDGQSIRSGNPQDWSMLVWGLARFHKTGHIVLPNTNTGGVQQLVATDLLQQHGLAGLLDASHDTPPLQHCTTGVNAAGAQSSHASAHTTHSQDGRNSDTLPHSVGTLMHQVYDCVANVVLKQLSPVFQQTTQAAAGHTISNLSIAQTSDTHSDTSHVPALHPHATHVHSHMIAVASLLSQGNKLTANELASSVGVIPRPDMSSSIDPSSSRMDSSPSWVDAERMRLELNALFSPTASDTSPGNTSSTMPNDNLKPQIPSYFVAGHKSSVHSSKRGSGVFMPLTLSSLAYSYAAVPHPKGRDVVQAVCSQAQQDLAHFAPSELADVMWAAACVQSRPAGFFEACLPQATRLVTKMQPQELATALWACSRLNQQYPPFIHAAAAASVQLLPIIPVHLRVCIIGALARLHCTSTEQLEVLLDGVQEVISELQQQELCHVLQACALLKLPHPVASGAATRLLRSHPAAPLPLLVDAARAATRLNHGLASALLQFAVQSATTDPTQLTTRTVVNLLWVAGSRGSVPDAEHFFHTTRSVVLHCVPKMQPVQLTTVLVSFAKIQHYDGALVSALCKHVLTCTGRGKSVMKNHAIAHAQLGQSEIGDQVLDNSSSFDGEQAALVLWALGHLRHYDTDVVEVLMGICEQEARVMGWVGASTVQGFIGESVQGTGGRGASQGVSVGKVAGGEWIGEVDEGELFGSLDWDAGATVPIPHNPSTVVNDVESGEAGADGRTVGNGLGIGNIVPMMNHPGSNNEARLHHSPENPAIQLAGHAHTNAKHGPMADVTEDWLNSALVWSGLRLVRSGRADPIGFHFLRDLGAKMHLDADRIVVPAPQLAMAGATSQTETASGYSYSNPTSSSHAAAATAGVGLPFRTDEAAVNAAVRNVMDSVHGAVHDVINGAVSGFYSREITADLGNSDPSSDTAISNAATAVPAAIPAARAMTVAATLNTRGSSKTATAAVPADSSQSLPAGSHVISSQPALNSSRHTHTENSSLPGDTTCTNHSTTSGHILDANTSSTFGTTCRSDSASTPASIYNSTPDIVAATATTTPDVEPGPANTSHTTSHLDTTTSSSCSSHNALSPSPWMEPRRLCRLLRTCSVFGVRSEWLTQLACQSVVEQPRAFSAWTLCRLAGTLAVLEVTDVQVYTRILELLSSLCGGGIPSRLSPPALAQLLRAHITLQDSTGTQLLSPSLYPGLLSACTSAALQNRRSRAGRQVGFVPEEVQQVTQALERLTRQISQVTTTSINNESKTSTINHTTSNMDGNQVPTHNHAYTPVLADASSTGEASAAGQSLGNFVGRGMHEGGGTCAHAVRPSVKRSVGIKDTQRSMHSMAGDSSIELAGDSRIELQQPVQATRPSARLKVGPVDIRGGLFSVDAVVWVGGVARGLVVHLPQHFTRTKPSQLLGFEQWRLKRLEREFAGGVVAVPWFEVAGMTEQQLQQYLKEQFQHHKAGAVALNV